MKSKHISSIQPHTVCILVDRRKVDEREWLERIERKTGSACRRFLARERGPTRKRPLWIFWEKASIEVQQRGSLQRRIYQAHALDSFGVIAATSPFSI